MSGTIEGGKLTAKINIAKYGKDYYKKIGTKGGKSGGKNKGFATMDRERLMELSAKGGKGRTGWRKYK